MTIYEFFIIMGMIYMACICEVIFIYLYCIYKRFRGGKDE